MSIIQNAKEIADLIKKIGDIDLYRKIVELESEIIELTREKRTLEETVSKLTEALRLKDAMRFIEPFYFIEGDKVPFCPKCWEAQKISVHVIDEGLFSNQHRYRCPNCQEIIWK